ncbi:iron ABC transporter ATP-binding protein [Leptolyngbya sp. 'hensonii']|uniref:ABC transporter ATP-binding protein n=1 Tax=Leptolyngbya sp. 'hensonii' TaxID=1922337 RepID=UPI000950175C|nr:ABC transporter ATP-binding protein [Leptolyngbya sp. 'hensonii']OLP16999.1 iron ABC transporter ATP-binding protein [Leptolyngbya sp. 'hensonii']
MILEARNLTGGYADCPIVRDINLSLEPGEWLSLVGANGSGKSTLLRLCSRILLPQGGTVLLDGKAIHTQSARSVARQLAILPQQQPIPAGLTVRQLVSLGRTPHQHRWQWELDQADRQQIERAIAQTDLEALANRPVEQLSGGERQRVFLALTLAQDPQILLLDEPTTFLDLHHQLELLELLKHLNQQRQLTLITVLHDVNLAARYSDRMAMLTQGHITAIGTPREVMTPDHLRQVFGVEAILLNTPVGLQVCLLSPTPTWPRSRDGPGVLTLHA